MLSSHELNFYISPLRPLMLILFCEVVKDQMRDERRHVVTFLDAVAYRAGKSDTPSWVSGNQFATTRLFSGH